MKIIGTVGPDGKIHREIDFQGAILPDGRNIDQVLKENEDLKKNVKELQTEVYEASSILVRLISNRIIRSAVESILIFGTVIGIAMLLWQII